MKFLLIVGILAVGSLSITLNQVQIMACCKNTISFFPGFIDSKTHLPYIHPSSNLTYTFSGLPQWLKADGNKLSGTPPKGVDQRTTATVTYVDISNPQNRGEADFDIVVGNGWYTSDGRRETEGIVFIQNYAFNVPEQGYTFTAVYPKNYSQKKEQLVEPAVLQTQTNIALPIAKPVSPPTTTSVKKVFTAAAPAEKSQVFRGSSGSIVTVTAIPKINTTKTTKTTTTTSTSNSTSPTSVQLPVALSCLKEQVELENSQSRLNQLQWQLSGVQRNITDRQRIQQIKNDTESQTISFLQTQLSDLKAALDSSQEDVSSYKNSINQAKSKIQQLQTKRDDYAKQRANETKKYEEFQKAFQELDAQVNIHGRKLADYGEDFTRAKNQLYANSQAKLISDRRLEIAKMEYEAAMRENQGIQDGIQSLKVLVNELESKYTNQTNYYYKIYNQSRALQAKAVMPSNLRTNPYDIPLQTANRDLEWNTFTLDNAIGHSAQLQNQVNNVQARLDQARKASNSANSTNSTSDPNKTNESNSKQALQSPEMSTLNYQADNLKISIKNLQKLVVANKKQLDGCKATPAKAAGATATGNQASAQQVVTAKGNLPQKKSEQNSSQTTSESKNLVLSLKVLCQPRENTIKGSGKVDSVSKDSISVGGKSIQIDECTQTSPADKKGNIKASDQVSYEGSDQNGKIIASKLTVN